MIDPLVFSSIITNVCAILYFTNKILKSCESNKGTFLWGRPWVEVGDRSVDPVSNLLASGGAGGGRGQGFSQRALQMGIRRTGPWPGSVLPLCVRVSCIFHPSGTLCT